MKRPKRLIAALTVTGMLVTFMALPASATPVSYARVHCNALIYAGVHGEHLSYWLQVHLLAKPASVWWVRAPANALVANNNMGNRQALMQGCMSTPGVIPPWNQ